MSTRTIERCGLATSGHRMDSIRAFCAIRVSTNKRTSRPHPLTGSTAASEGTENFSVYSASKAAVHNFARSWVLELRTRGIRVNVISPGAIATPGLAGLVPSEHKDGLFEALAKVTPMGRLGKPEEIAKAVAFLASDDASYINGIELFVDGGKAQV